MTPEERRRRRPKTIFVAVMMAAAIMVAISAYANAGTNRPLRYYDDNGRTAMTYYTNGSANNDSYWGINTDDPRCELDINGTVCINRSGFYYNGVNLTPSADGNNYPTALTVNSTNGNYTIQLARSGLSTLVANFTVNTTSGGSGGGISRVDLNNGTGINVSGNGTNYTIGVANLQACNSVTEYSVWNGSHWLCDNDGGGTTYTFNNTDGLVNLSGSPSLIINLNLTAMDLRYTLRSVYDAFVTAITASAGGWTNTSTQTTTQLRVGINNTAPNATLDVTGTLTVRTPTNGIIQLNDGTNANAIWGINGGFVGSNGFNNIVSRSNGIKFYTGSTINTMTLGTERGVINATNGYWGINNSQPNSTLHIVGNASIEHNVNTPNLIITNTNAGQTEALRINRPGVGGLFFTTAGGSPATANIGSLSSGLTQAAPIKISTASSGNYVHGDVTIGPNGGTNNPASYYSWSANKVGFNTSAPNATVHVLGTANITRILTEEICLNSDCRTAWPAGGSGSGGNMSQFTVSDGTTATTIYNNSQVTFTAGSNMVITNNGGNFTFAASVSGGSGNVSGNGTSGYLPLWNGATTQNNSRLFQNSTALALEQGDFLMNGYSADRLSLNYFYPQHTEFCDSTVNNGGSGGAFVAGAVSSGVISFTSSSIGQANHPCIVSILDSTTSGGGAFYSAGPNSGILLQGGENTTVIFRTTVSAGKVNVTHRFGFLDSATTAEPTDGAYMQFNISYPNSAAGNVLYAMTTNNSVRTSSAVNTTYSFANNTWYIANVALSLDGTIAYFKLYNETGNLLWNTSIGSNIPRSSGRETSQKWISMQSTTDSASTIAELDYMDFKILRPVRSVVLNG